jgi:hypothetical protein
MAIYKKQNSQAVEQSSGSLKFTADKYGRLKGEKPRSLVTRWTLNAHGDKCEVVKISHQSIPFMDFFVRWTLVDVQVGKVCRD